MRQSRDTIGGVKTVDLDHWLREHAIEVFHDDADQIVYLNRATGRSTSVPRRPEISDEFARDLCFQLEVPVPVSVKPRR